MKTVSASQYSPSKSSYRPEIQGLRALAVGLVLLFHLWPNRLSGGFVGVDVFFVISGYLIIGHLHKELSSTGRIAVTKFWARRVMRLLPLAFLVLVVSTIALLLWLPETVWQNNIRQIIASLIYIENWVLALDSVDYMAADNEPSLVQHYWSLSIEEQFYFALPIIFLVTLAILKGLRRKQFAIPAIKWMAVTLGVLAISSFCYSIWFTGYDQAQAYFVTPTRFWEFCIGGFVALAPQVSKTHRALRNTLGWMGLAMILGAGYFYTGGTPFPGYTALLPVLGAALFIYFGSSQPIIGVYWLASRRPLVLMGDWSYAIYLWHWPLIIVSTYSLDPFTWQHKLVIIAATFALALASQKYVEDPLRHAATFKVPRRAFGAMAVSIVLIAGSTLAAQALLMSESRKDVKFGECVGADALLNDCDDLGLEGDPLTSSAQVEKEKNEPAFPQCFIPAGKTDFDRSDCSLGADPESAEITIAVFGSSHARMWLPMFDEIGKQNNWNIQGYTKSACSPVPLTTADNEMRGRELSDAEGCYTFNIETAELLKEDPTIDVIVTASLGSSENHYLSDGTVATDSQKIEAIDAMWKEWQKAGKRVVTFGEVPNFSSVKAPTCVASNKNEIVDECSVSYEKSLGSRKTFQRLTVANGHSDTSFYDPAPGICREDTCYSMVGGLISRYDHHHLSEDFAKSYGDHFTDFMQDEVLK